MTALFIINAPPLSITDGGGPGGVAKQATGKVFGFQNRFIPAG
jgi:hypothetical protein